ncbi:flavin reductase [Psychrobacter lutiphocae]|uniref:flavin reductase n=1 Tax=Psychrobacter lutiphocae TaxID=540500 RepID=UPI00036E4C0F|nr:flavin reductase [Psychrobacter lutiphocae]
MTNKQFDPKALRAAFGSYMTGVTVITTMSAEGTPIGFTANSFTSVSLEPALLSVCPAKSLSSFDVFANCERFAVNILSEDQQHISNIFAGSKEDRFSQVDWHTDEHGNPVLDGVLTHFSCKTHNNIDAGDHIILIGEVLDFATREGLGLGYASGGYFSLGLEREAAEMSAQQQQVHVGVIIEHQGKVLLCTENGKSSLPYTLTDDNTSAVEAVTALLADNKIHAKLGAVFSIYDNPKNNNSYIFYRAFADSEDIGNFNNTTDNLNNPVDSSSLTHYVALDQLSAQTYTTPALASMMIRYAAESKNGMYGVYVGHNDSGKVH